jgi:hypothetical protein
LDLKEAKGQKAENKTCGQDLHCISPPCPKTDGAEVERLVDPRLIFIPLPAGWRQGRDAARCLNSSDDFTHARWPIAARRRDYNRIRRALAPARARGERSGLSEPGEIGSVHSLGNRWVIRFALAHGTTRKFLGAGKVGTELSVVHGCG